MFSVEERQERRRISDDTDGGLHVMQSKQCRKPWNLMFLFGLFSCQCPALFAGHSRAIDTLEHWHAMIGELLSVTPLLRHPMRRWRSASLPTHASSC